MLIMILARWNGPPRRARRGDWLESAAASAMAVGMVMAVPAQ
jgi:hypothetical protein